MRLFCGRDDMDILKILQTSPHDVTPDDLLMFEDALAVGDYESTATDAISDALYRDTCSKLISQIRNWSKVKDGPNVVWDADGDADKESVPFREGNAGVIVDGTSFAPFNESVPVSKSPSETVASDLAAMRRMEDHRNRFRSYIATSEYMTEAFIDGNFSLFEPLEVDCILAEIPFSEAFLEKRFSQINSEIVARYQVFSEEFFMRHFVDLDTETVLNKGVNPWRDKANRSSKLGVFLRLKGIRL